MVQSLGSEGDAFVYAKRTKTSSRVAILKPKRRSRVSRFGNPICLRVARDAICYPSQLIQLLAARSYYHTVVHGAAPRYEDLVCVATKSEGLSMPFAPRPRANLCYGSGVSFLPEKLSRASSPVPSLRLWRGYWPGFAMTVWCATWEPGCDGSGAPEMAHTARPTATAVAM